MCHARVVSLRVRVEEDMKPIPYEGRELPRWQVFVEDADEKSPWRGTGGIFTFVSDRGRVVWIGFGVSVLRGRPSSIEGLDTRRLRSLPLNLWSRAARTELTAHLAAERQEL